MPEALEALLVDGEESKAMPFSSELGMNVYDPSQGVQEGQMAGRAAIDAFQEARRLKLDERKLKMIEEDTARKASATLLRQQGLSEMKDLIDGGMPFKDALFKVSPKLFVDNPEALGQIAHQDAVEKATEAYKQATLEINRKAKEAQAQHQANMEEPPEIRLARKTAQLRAEAEQPTTDQGPDTGVAPKSPAAMTLEELRRQQEAKTKSKVNAKEKDRADLMNLMQRRRDLQGLSQSQPENQEWKDMLQKTNDEIDILTAQLGMREETTDVQFPGGGGLRIVKGGPQKTTATPTVAEETRLGNDVQATANSLRVLNRLEGQLNSGAVGILPTLSTVIFDEVLGQLAPDLVDKNRVAARQNVGVATQQVLGELNNQGRISNMELNAIKNAMPGLGALSSAEQGKVKIRELQKVLAEKGAHAAVTLKRDIPSETMQTLSRMTDEELANDAQQGALDPIVFWKVFRMKHPQPQPTAVQPAP